MSVAQRLLELMNELKFRFLVRLTSSNFGAKACPICGELLYCQYHGEKYMEFVDTPPEFAFCTKCDPGWPSVKHLHYNWEDGNGAQSP
jgi:hypothetical protein